MKYIPLVFLLVLLNSNCSKPGLKLNEATKVILDSAARHNAENALQGMDVLAGYELSLFASEPMFQNPTNIDIDHKGRVYVCEAYNYRPQFSGIKTKFEGDRIMILEDTNGDGKADISKVFYQGPEINAPLGICVLDNEVIVSQSPFVWKFTDTDGDDKADKKEILFQSIKGIQDDHGVHALTLGADGKFYFSMGNASKTISDKNDKIIKTITGDPIDETHFRQGLILRGNLDGTGFEVIGQNFRNNYECTVDAFGNVWQTDNDDDGNRATRLNYILEYGNYGYRDEITNADWRAFRANIEDSIPLRHWHQHDPGVVPNLLNLGSGSPCGLMMYQGEMIKELQGSLLHAEALHHVLRAYKPSQQNATVSATNLNVIKQNEDDWFRPVDIAAAPDGSLFIADWYDPGVGGHYAGDQTKGRIYRLASKANVYKIPTFDKTKNEDIVQGLSSPNLSIRSLSQLKLRALGKEAITLLQPVLENAEQELKSRALFILGDLDQSYIELALNDKNEDIKIAGLRMARQDNATSTALAINTLLSQENSDKVWRECAIALRNTSKKDRIQLWPKLASRYQKSDRWFLEALGIGADGIWDEVMPLYLNTHKDISLDYVKDILWRSRSKHSLTLLQKLASESKGREQLKYIRSLDFINDPLKNKILLELVKSANDSAISLTLIKSLDPKQIKSNVQAMDKVLSTIEASTGEAYMDLIERFYPNDQLTKLSGIVKAENLPASLKSRAGKALVKLSSITALYDLYTSANENEKKSILAVLGSISSNESINLISRIIKLNESPDLVKEAYKNMGRGWNGEEYVLKAFVLDQIPKEYLRDAMTGPLNAWRKPVREKAREIMNLSNSAHAEFNISAIVLKSGNAVNGAVIFTKTCAACHKIKNSGIDFGPPLDDIGSKYGKDALYTSIIDPSKSINFGYEGEQITTNNGGIYVGIKSNETSDEIVLKMADGQKELVSKKNIKERIKLKQSLMTPYLYQNMTEQELIDLVEYLTTLKKNI